MGADLCFGYIFDLNTSTDMAKRIDKIIKHIAGLSKKELEYNFKYVFENSGEDLPETKKEILKELKILLEDFRDSLGGRDIGEIMIGSNCSLIFSGGMSHGDSPTTSCDLLYQIAEFPESILKKADLAVSVDVFELFMNENSNRLTDCLKDQLMKWKTLTKV